jgi:hypothetical protein
VKTSIGGHLNRDSWVNFYRSCWRLFLSETSDKVSRKPKTLLELTRYAALLDVFCLSEKSEMSYGKKLVNSIFDRRLTSRKTRLASETLFDFVWL